MAPGVNRVVVLGGRFASRGYLHRMEAMASSVGLKLTPASAKDPGEIEHAIDLLAREPNPGLIVLSSEDTMANHIQIIQLAARYRLPAVYPHRRFAAWGGLISYGIDTAYLYREAAFYADRILKGAKAANLRVQTPAKYELIINLNAARGGLTVPPTLLARADEIIDEDSVAAV